MALNLVRFRFACNETNMGDTLLLMSDWLEWSEDSALEFKCTKFPEWECEAFVPTGMHHFKLLLVRANSERRWEPCGKNREIEVADGGPCFASGTFGMVDQSIGARPSVTLSKSCQRCGSVISCYSNCPKCWGPVTQPPRTLPNE